MKASKPSILTLCLSAAMLAVALLLPLVNLMSYRFTLFELPHKIQRLVNGGVSQTIAFLLLALLVLAPLCLALVALVRRRVPQWLLGLPAIVSALLVVLLLLASKPNPGIGLWIYLALAVISVAISRVFPCAHAPEKCGASAEKNLT